MDVGTLIDSGGSNDNKPIFSVAQSGIMRIFVNIPQTNVALIHDGMTAELRVQELPGRVFQATVTRFTHEIDMTSRSMLAILRVPNPTGVLLPGMYAEVRFPGKKSGSSTLIIPGDALLLTSQGTRVAVVDADGRVHFQDVKVGTDFGSDVEIKAGLHAGDLVIMNPTDAIKNGVQVEIHKTA